ncbi:MAG: cupin domain-containing protein, partial [Elusimicrobiota bacterium]
MKNKNKDKIIYGNIKTVACKQLGELETRVIEAAKPFDITLLHEKLPPNGSAPYVVHSKTIELIHITKGTAVGILNGKQINLCEGDYLYIPAGVEHRFETKNTGVEAISIFSPPMDSNKPDAKIV